MNRAFKFKQTIQLYHVDAASILFYGQLFFLIHNALDAFLNEIDFSIKDRLKKKDFFYPVVHVEANYSKPLTVGDVLEMELSVEKIGTTSFTIAYALFCKGEVVGDAKTVHVSISPKEHVKVALPKELKEILLAHLKKG